MDLCDVDSVRRPSVVTFIAAVIGGAVLIAGALLVGVLIATDTSGEFRALHAEFQSKRTNTLAAMRSAMEAGDPAMARKIGQRYREVADAEFMKLLSSADQAAELAERAAWRRQGVAVGMTAERVLLSSWGPPQKVNRTVSSSGVSEQWVYAGGNYLYFQDGVLRTIQVSP